MVLACRLARTSGCTSDLAAPTSAEPYDVPGARQLDDTQGERAARGERLDPRGPVRAGHRKVVIARVRAGREHLVGFSLLHIRMIRPSPAARQVRVG